MLISCTICLVSADRVGLFDDMFMYLFLCSTKDTAVTTVIRIFRGKYDICSDTMQHSTSALVWAPLEERHK